MKRLLPWMVVVLAMPLFGCGSNNEQGIRDSREDFMIEFKKALAESNISFTVDDEGYVRYSREDTEAIDQIKRQVDQRRAREVGSRFEDELSTKYFRSLLDRMKISYRTESREDGEWTYWHPESQQQQEEIEMKVVAHAFKQQKGRSDNRSKQTHQRENI